MVGLKKKEELFIAIRQIVEEAHRRVLRQSNTILLQMYWEIGKLIVEDEQKGKARAEYGKRVLKELSKKLTMEFGRGFDESNLKNMRIFYRAFPIRDSLRHELSWTHYRILSRIEDAEKRQQYIELAIAGNWNTRVLQRNVNSMYLQRSIETDNKRQTGITPSIKDPYILEFLGLSNREKNPERNIEEAIINHLQQFLMELGKGFAFVARQQHIVTDTSDFFIDLVFYNYFLKCFVLIDLKTGPLKHEHIGQMDMYVRMYDDIKNTIEAAWDKRSLLELEDVQDLLGIITAVDLDLTYYELGKFSAVITKFTDEIKPKKSIRFLFQRVTFDKLT